MTYESDFLFRMRLEKGTDKTDKKNSVSFDSRSLRTDSESMNTTRSCDYHQFSDKTFQMKNQSQSMQDEQRIESFEEMIRLFAWLEKCQPGDDWRIPPLWENEAQRWQLIADARIRRRNQKLRIWRNVEGYLVCKLALYQ